MSRSRLVAALCVVVASACGDDRDAAAFRVALLTPGSIADGGWNAGAYEGLREIRERLGAEVRHVETRTPAEFEEGFRDFAGRGYTLVFGHGFEYQEAAARVGAEFPETVFITTSGDTVRSNVAPMVFELEQATYLCGVLAARMTETGRIGLIGGIDLPSIRSTFQAFRGGVSATRSDVEVREVFIGNFDDTAAAREAALALLEEGADLLLHQANAAGRGVFRAVSDRAAAGARVFAFGINRDQNAMAPEVVLASATLDIPAAFVEVATRVREGRFTAEPVRLGMNEGIVHLVLNPRLRARIPAATLDEIDRIEASIRSGELVVPRGAF
ncbi:MAG: BMP family protein [Myxococcales bacterium]|nr:BMP family protein [Myxococcales bacterium]